jgi:hypothetical protein
MRPTMEEAPGTGRALYVSVSIQAIAQRRRSTDLARAVQPSRRILVQLADFFRSEPSYLPIRGNLLRAISRISATVAAKSVHPRNSINSRAKLFPSTLPLIAVFGACDKPSRRVLANSWTRITPAPRTASVREVPLKRSELLLYWPASAERLKSKENPR